MELEVFWSKYQPVPTWSETPKTLEHVKGCVVEVSRAVKRSVTEMAMLGYLHKI